MGIALPFGGAVSFLIMARNFPIRPIRSLRPLLLLPLSSLAQAADFTWNGGAPVLNNWSTQANWVQPGAPPLSDTTTALTFSGGTRTAPNAQAAYTINSIVFSGTSAGFNLNGSTITFGGLSPFLRNSSSNNHTINNPTSWGNGGSIRAQTSNLTFTGQISALGGSLNFRPDTGHTIQTGVIAGPGSITKTGGGVLQNNSGVLLSGAVSVSGGTLRLGNTFLGGDYDSFTGANLELNGSNATFTRLSGSGNIDLTGGTLNINQSTDSSASSPITGAGNLTKTGTGVLSLSGNLNYSGTTTINGGTLRPTGFLTLSSRSRHDIGAGGTLDMGGETQIIRGLTGSGSIINNDRDLIVDVRSVTNVWSGAISGTGLLQKEGDGILALTSNLSHSGGTVINNGTLAISNSGALGANASPTTINSGAALQISSTVTVSRAKTITLTGAGPSDGGAIRFETLSGTGDAFIESNLALAGDATITHASTAGFLNLGRPDLPGTLNIGSHDLTLNGSGGGDIRIRHALQGSGALIHNRAQNLFLQGSSPAFTGPIQVLDGSVKVENTNSLGSVLATAPITLAAGATLDLENDVTLVADRPLQLANGSTLVSRSQATWAGDGDIILNGVVSGNDLETASASNSLTISGNGMITGNAATLDVDAVTESTITIDRDINLTGLTIGQTGLRKTGGGTLILSGQADYSGSTRVDGGILRLTASEQLPSASTFVLGGGTLDLNGFTQTSAGIVGAGNINLGAGTLKIQAEASFIKTFSQSISGTGTLEILNSVGIQRFLSPNTYTGPTIVRSGGKLLLESDNALGPHSALTIETGGSVTVDSAVLRVSSLAGGGSLDLLSPTSKLDIDSPVVITLSGTINGAGTVEKNGNSQATLLATQFYSGETRVRQGILVARGGLPNSEVIVDTGAILSIQGAISGASVSGSLQPSINNQPPSTLDINGPLTFQSGGTLVMRIQDWNGSPGTGNSVIDCETLNFNSGPTPPVNINVILNEPLSNFEEAPRTFKLIRASSGVINNFQESSNVVINVTNGTASPEGTWSLRVLNGDLEAVYTPAASPGYETWIADYDLGLLTGPNDDPDNDGIPNLIEFILGGNPENVDDSGKLPTSTVDATHIEFVFRRSAASAYLNPAVRYGINLVAWDTAIHNEDGVTISSESHPTDPDIELVTVRIPRSGEPRRFAQLLAELPVQP